MLGRAKNSAFHTIGWLFLCNVKDILRREQGGTPLPFDREARAGGATECYCQPIQEVTEHLHRQSVGPMSNFPDWGNLPPSKRGSSKARGRWQVGEAVEGRETGQLDGKSTGARIGKGRKMPYNALICNL